MAAQGEVNNKPNQVGADSLASALPHATAATLTNNRAISSPVRDPGGERAPRVPARAELRCWAPPGLVPRGFFRFDGRRKSHPGVGATGRMRGCLGVWNHRIGREGSFEGSILWEGAGAGDRAGDSVLCDTLLSRGLILPHRGASTGARAGFVPWLVPDTPEAPKTGRPVR